ncbi:MAG TPA: SAM-dependent methyltransferase, partial [Candidatus Wallbacteria bacterium]|nr:SAM-dependent methyltransferase [Candidatus Wallbacteria bacterium]
MAFDQTTRNKLQNFVSQARNLLSKEFTRQLQNDYGIDPETGSISELDSLTHLDDAKFETARLLRDTYAHYLQSNTNSSPKDVLDRIVREQAFTVLNRICAIRMAEARNIIIESIAGGYNSKGFQLYSRLAGTALGEKGDVYRSYIYSIYDEFAVDLAVLFDRFSPTGRLFPKESVLLDLLSLVNDAEISGLWSEDETIGWIYQYFNSIEERKKMRAESQAPRNSR